MKLNITIIFLLLFGASLSADAPGQTTTAPNAQPCRLRLKDSPTIRGLRLEMTKAEVKKEYPSMVFTDDFPKGEFKERDNAGLAKKAQIADSAHKENLEQVMILFGKDNRILTVDFVFYISAYGSSLKEFAGKVSESLKLPENQWQPSRGGNSLALYCDGFGLFVKFNEEKKPFLFLAKAPDALTGEDKDNLKP